jgi:hypothetical protein
VDPWAVAVGVTGIGAAGVYWFVAHRLSQRPIAAPARLAASQFTLWWYGLAASGALGGLEGILGAFKELSFPLAMTFLILNFVLDCALLWGLVGYLTYLYTGKYHLPELTGFYALFFTAAVYYTFAEAPYAVVMKSGAPTILYGTMVNNPLLIAFIIIALVVPEFAAALFYLSLVRRTQDRTIRFRIVLVSSSILMWFLIDLFTSQGGSPALAVIRGALSAGAALLSLIAFYPPESVQRRFGVTAVSSPKTDLSSVA